MVKIAVFVEGLTEQVFVRTMLFQIVDASIMSFKCVKLHAGGQCPVSYDHQPPDPRIHFLILNVEGDSRVLSAIKERERKLFEAGYRKIIGLRDMYCCEYDKKSSGVIDQDLIKSFVKSTYGIIDEMSRPSGIEMHFAIMEIEAWFLGMYNIFRKLDNRLSPEVIESSLGIDLKGIDPQKKFYRPAVVIKQVLALAGINYKKSRDNCEMICSCLDISDINDAIEDNRCGALKDFYWQIKRCAANLRSSAGGALPWS